MPDDHGFTTPTASAVSTPMPLVCPTPGRVGWLCARCGRSYAPDVRECLACAPGMSPGYTYVYPTYVYPHVYALRGARGEGTAGGPHA